MVIKGRCKRCDHLFTWDEERYSIQNHIVRCKGCGAFLGGGLRCGRCKNTVLMLNGIFPPGYACHLCGAPYDEPIRDAI